MANYVPLICYDFETAGKYPYISQPLSLSCVAIDPVRLEIISGSEFNSYIRPVLDPEECKKRGIEEVQDEALNVNKIKIEDVIDAPSPEEVTRRFVEHVSKYSNGTGKWNKPIPVTYNGLKFDHIIIDRLAKEFGYWDDERQTNNIFHPRDAIDVLHIVWQLFENNKNQRSISFDTVRTYLGLSKENAHSSLVDCIQVSCFLIRWMKWHRASVKKMNLQNSFTNIDLSSFYDVQK